MDSSSGDRVGGAAGGAFDAQVVKCVVCGCVQASVRELEMHVALDHVNFVPYECVLCRYVRLPTEWSVLAHVKDMHPGSECRVTYKFDENFSRQRDVVCDIVRRSLNSASQSFTRFPLPTSSEQHSYNSSFHGNVHISALPSPSPTSTPIRFSQPSASLASTSAIQQSVQSPLNRTIASSSAPQTPSHSTANPLATSAITALLSSTQQPQPIVPQLQGSGSTALCGRCGVAVRLSLPAMNYHVWSRHMPSMRVQCPYCPYGRTTGGQSSVERVQQHCRSQHPKKDDSIIQPDNRPELQSQHRAELEICFGIQSQVLSASSEQMLSPPQNGAQQSIASTLTSSSGIRVDQPPKSQISEEISSCQVCGHRINHNSGRVNVNSQQYHVWSRHMNEPCFQCAYCSFTVRSPFDVSRLRSHAIRQHYELPFKRIDLRNQ
uniref:C2H2-type domain-containing protein n=1 Tax=Plectus sambesii TaxID=2011161 RepID=A0A914WJ53_9BILA